MDSKLAAEVIRMAEDDYRKHRWATPDQINGMLADLTNLMEAAKALTSERDELREALVESVIPYEALLGDTESRRWIAPSIWEAMRKTVVRARKLIETN